MKKIIVLIVFAIFAFHGQSSGQTLTSTSNPAFPDIFYINNCDYLPPGPSGMGQFWDFTNAKAKSYTKVICTFLHDTGLEFFQPANLAVINSNLSGPGPFGGYAVQTSASGITCAGENNTPASPFVSMAYSNPQTVLSYPCSFGSSYTDTWATTYTQTSTVHYRTGTTTFLADATGTIVTSSGTYNDVLRIHSVKNYRDSIFVGTPFVNVCQKDQYTWYMPGVHIYILSIATETSSFAATTQTLTYKANGPDLGIQQASAAAEKIVIYPNPASDFFTIGAKNEFLVGETTINIKDLFGREIKQLRLNSLDSDLGKVDISDLANGIYILSLSNTNEVIYAGKLVKAE